VTYLRVFAVGTLVLVSCCSLWLSGCKPAEGIHQVRVPAEYSERRGAKPTLPAATSEAPEAGGLHYKTPTGWTIKANGPMRLASLDIIDGEQKCDVSIIRLGPDQPVLENVNRWRGQIKLAPTTEGELQLKPIQCGGHDGQLVQLVGEAETILGVIVPLPDATWFVKLQGPNALALRELEKFVAFTESIELP
jgi:hypothetical protein